MQNLFFIIGLIAIFISGASLGAWTDRKNFYEETAEHRSFRLKMGTISGIVGVVCITITIVIFYFQNN